MVTPQVMIDGRPFKKIQDMTFLPPGTIEMERFLFYERHEAVRAYARANTLNIIETHTGDDRIGLVSAGKSYADLRQSLLDMDWIRTSCSAWAFASCAWV